MNRTDRLYAIVEELRAAAPRPVSGTRLATRFEVTIRTIERDISALQASGAAIYAEAGRTGGYVLDASATLPPVNFSAAEATAIAVALARAGDSPFAAESRSALLKVLHAMPAAHAADAAQLVGRIRLVERVSPSSGPNVGPRDEGTREHAATYDSMDSTPAVQRLLAEAVTRHVVASLDYTDRTGALTQRWVEPVGLLCGPRGWYLIAWCRLRQDGRAFRLDRVTGVRLTDQPAPQRSMDDVMERIPDMRVRIPELD